jgi:hypothetical protein
MLTYTKPDYKKLLSDNGIQYKGTQKDASGVDCLVYFDNSYGSTLAIYISKFSIEAVKEKIRLSDADFQAEALRISKSTAKLTQDARTPDKPDIIIDHFKHADKKRI